MVLPFSFLFRNALFRCLLHRPMRIVSCHFLLFWFLLLGSIPVFSQPATDGYKSQEVSDVDGVPVLIKNLPDSDRRTGAARITNRIEEVRAEFGEPSVLSGIDLAGGAEAAFADYPEGRLLVIEYPTPQASVSADAEILARLGGSPGVVYKRVGNYNAFVFGAADAGPANALLDKLTYAKTVQWLGDDPYFLQRFERYIAMTGRDMVISTVLFIAGVLMAAAVLGIIVGIFYYRFREQERSRWHGFSDAGGLTRLNLDDLSER